MADVVVLTVVLILTFPPTLGCKVLVWEMFAKAWAILGKIPWVGPCGQNWLRSPHLQPAFFCSQSVRCPDDRPALLGASYCR